MSLQLPSALVAAARDGDANQLAKILSRGVDGGLDARPESIGVGLTAMETACFGGHRDLVVALAAAGASTSTRHDEYGDTPLHYAAKATTGEAVLALVAISRDWQRYPLAFIDFNAQNLGGQTPLHVSAFSSRPESVAALLDAGADANITDGRGLTPLDLVRSTGLDLVPLQEAETRVRDLLEAWAEARAVSAWFTLVLFLGGREHVYWEAAPGGSASHDGSSHESVD